MRVCVACVRVCVESVVRRLLRSVPASFLGFPVRCVRCGEIRAQPPAENQRQEDQPKHASDQRTPENGRRRAGETNGERARDDDDSSGLLLPPARRGPKRELRKDRREQNQYDQTTRGENGEALANTQHETTLKFAPRMLRT